MPWRESPQLPASPRAASHAKILRRSVTDAERRLWCHLKQRVPIDGSHFRRQVALGSYVADLCCLSARVIVEVDGAQHTFDCNEAYDERRSISLGQQGFRVLRFTNAEVMHQIDFVLDTIFVAVESGLSARYRSKGLTATVHAFPPGEGAASEP